MRLHALVVSVSLVSACAGTPLLEPDGGAAPSEPVRGLSVQLVGSAATISAGQTLVVTANMTGGELSFGDLREGLNAASTFTKSADGRWVASLTWEALVSRELSGRMDQPTSVELVADFTDVSGYAAQARLTVGLACGDSQSLCGGTCQRQDQDSNNCGGCGLSCGGTTPQTHFIGPGLWTNVTPTCQFGKCGLMRLLEGYSERESCATQCATRWSYLGRPLRCAAACDPSAFSAGSAHPALVHPLAGSADYRDAQNRSHFIRFESCDDVPPDLSAAGSRFDSVACCCVADL